MGSLDFLRGCSGVFVENKQGPRALRQCFFRDNVRWRGRIEMLSVCCVSLFGRSTRKMSVSNVVGIVELS